MQTAIARNKEQSQTESTLSKKPNNLVELKKEDGGNAGVPIFLQRRALYSAASFQFVQRQPVEEEEEKSSVSVAESQVQAQLTVGAPDDEYERKADQVADTVMRMPDSHVAQPFEEEQEEVSGQSSVVQTKSNGEESLASNHQVDKAIRSPGGGSPLAEHIRARVGPLLDIDLHAVRVHDDSQGHAAARSINAKAFTHKNHIYLGKGQSPGNLRLMAHEATHVAQQTEHAGASQRSQSPAMRKPMVQRFNESTETETTSTGSQNCDANEANPIIWFEHNSTNLRQENEANSVLNLMRLVGRIQRYLANAGSYGFVFLYGYASEEGEPGHNLLLSMNRALYVRQLLIDAGVPAERMFAMGRGESRTFQELRWNRRVEVCLTPPVTNIEFEESEEITVARINCRNPPSSISTFNEYVQLVECLEQFLPNLGPREMLSLLRQTYYGGRRFSEAIPCESSVSLSRLWIPVLFRLAIKNSKVVGGVDIGHLFTGLDAMMCPQASVEFEIDWLPNITVEMPNVELVTWGGDLGSAAAIWTEDQFDNRLRRPVTDYVGGENARYACAEDLRGDIDSYVLRNELMGRTCNALPVIPEFERPLSSVLFDYYVRDPEGEAPTDQQRSRCFALAIGASLSGNSITNKDRMVNRYKPRIFSFADPFYFRRHKAIYIWRGVGYVLRLELLRKKSGLVMRAFLDWLENNMR